MGVSSFVGAVPKDQVEYCLEYFSRRNSGQGK